jgi:excisionase family DNA binding protein
MIAGHKNNDWISVGQAAREFGFSAPTIRKFCERGCSYSTSIGGHRRISRRALQEYLGLTEPTTNTQTSTPLALVYRVSGAGQSRKSSPTAECSSLEHQQKRVDDFAREKFGESAFAQATRYPRVGSGLAHNHPTLVKLITDILSGKYKNGFIIAQDSIRIMRFGNEIFGQVCKFGGCEILYVMEPDRTDAEADLTQSILGIITHFTAKASGLRAKKILEICIDNDVLVKIYERYKEGLSYKDLSVWAKKEGLTGTKGQPLSPAKLCQIINRNAEVLSKLVPTGKSSFMKWYEENVVQRQGSMVGLIEVYDRYSGWCAEQGEQPLSNKKVSLMLRQMGIKAGRKSGWRIFEGVVLR